MTTADLQTQNQQLRQPPFAPQNVSTEERVISTVVGGALIVSGIARGSLGGLALAAAGGGLLHRGVSGHCLAYEFLGINRAGFDNNALGVRAKHGYKHVVSMTIDRPPAELYRFWRQLDNLPQVMEHLIAVDEDGNRSHWVARAPMIGQVAWDAEIINERENELIAWRSLPGSELDTAGSVHFESAPGNRGTKLTISLKYDPPGGKVGASIASIFGAGFEQVLEADLRAVKQRLESGEVPTIVGQTRGRCSG
jgi:uncharacterized membrane protein